MLAPVLITVYNRHDHIRECIDYLLKCSLASQTEVFISSDAASKPEDAETISQLRSDLKTISGFRKITIVERQNNLGSFNNFITSINEILSVSDRIIVLEDDCLVAPYFLEYMNSSLDLFYSNESVFSVTGYNYPVTMPADYTRNTYLWQGFSAWGVGIWKHKWMEMNWEDSYIDKCMLNIRKVIKVMKIANHILPVLYYDRRRGRVVSDAVITINLIDKGLYSIFPISTLVRNIGADGFGESRVRSDRIRNQQIDQSKFLGVEKNPQINPQINKALFNYFWMSRIAKLKFYTRLFILKNLFGFE